MRAFLGFCCFFSVDNSLPQQNRLWLCCYIHTKIPRRFLSAAPHTIHIWFHCPHCTVFARFLYEAYDLYVLHVASSITSSSGDSFCCYSPPHRYIYIVPAASTDPGAAFSLIHPALFPHFDTRFNKFCQKQKKLYNLKSVHNCKLKRREVSVGVSVDNFYYRHDVDVKLSCCWRLTEVTICVTWNWII